MATAMLAAVPRGGFPDRSAPTTFGPGEVLGIETPPSTRGRAFDSDAGEALRVAARPWTTWCHDQHSSQQPTITVTNSRKKKQQQKLGALLTLSFLSATATAGDHGLTVFWGRNKDEGSLGEACDTGIYNTVIISFYSVFGHGKYWGDLSGHPLYGIGADIKHCRGKGIVVLLSIGGGGTQYSLPSSQSAADVADNLWNAHLGGARRGVFRPFGDAVVDGIDFFIDQGAPDYYDELARRLSGYNRHYRGAPGVRLTATPRCVFPDWHVQRALDTGLFERIHVRFYGEDRCSYNHVYKDGVMAQWSKWTARYPRSKVYIGLPAANVPGRNDKVGLPSMNYDLMPSVKQAANYGGVMLWDRYYDKQTGYGRDLYNGGIN